MSEEVVNNQKEEFSFDFNTILHNRTQEETYQECARQAMLTALNGYNATIMAYGQTGAGKTYTMLGASESYEHRGIVPRSISEVFHELDKRGGEDRFEVRITVLEFYNNTIVDLLAGVRGSGHSRKDLALTDQGETVVVKDAVHALVNSEAEAFRVLFQGQAERTTRCHDLNDQSSRSHLVFTLHLTSAANQDSSITKSSKINFVDLAGADPIRPTVQSSKELLQEAGFINKSHTFLEQVVLALSQRAVNGKAAYVPYRQSKLTHYLKDSLGGNCYSTLIANIYGDKVQIADTVQTLRFAQRMSTIVNHPVLNVAETDKAVIRRQQSEITLLRQELAVRDSLDERKVGSYQPFNHLEQLEIKKLASKYAGGEIDTIPVHSLRQVMELFRQFRGMVEAAESKAPPTVALSGDGVNDGAGSDGAATAAASGAGGAGGMGVLAGNGFSVGVAANGPKMQNKKKERAKSSKKTHPVDSATSATDADSKYDEANRCLKAMVTNGLAKVAVDVGLHDVRFKVDLLKALATSAGAQEDCKEALVQFLDELEPNVDEVAFHELIDKLPEAVDILSMSRDEAYEHFKKSGGKEDGQALGKNNTTLHAHRLRSRNLAIALNKLKELIDNKTEEMNEMHSYFQNEHAPDSESNYPVMDKPVFNLFQEINAMKAQYKEKRGELTSISKECASLEMDNRECRKRLLGSFTGWYANVTGGEVADLSAESAGAAGAAPPQQLKSAKVFGSVGGLTGESRFNVTRNAMIRRLSKSPEKARRLSMGPMSPGTKSVGFGSSGRRLSTIPATKILPQIESP